MPNLTHPDSPLGGEENAKVVAEVSGRSAGGGRTTPAKVVAEVSGRGGVGGEDNAKVVAEASGKGGGRTTPR